MTRGFAIGSFSVLSSGLTPIMTRSHKPEPNRTRLSKVYELDHDLCSRHYSAVGSKFICFGAAFPIPDLARVSKLISLLENGLNALGRLQPINSIFKPIIPPEEFIAHPQARGAKDPEIACLFCGCPKFGFDTVALG